MMQKHEFLFGLAVLVFSALVMSQSLFLEIAKVMELDSPPSRRDFMQKYRHAPFIVKHGALDGWDAKKSWSDEYLKKQAGDVVFSVERSPSREFGDLAEGWRFQNMSLGEFIDRPVVSGQPNFYLNGLVPKALHSDILMPPFVPCLGQPRPPFARLINMWFGKGGEVSLLHNDLQDNVLHMVRGEKRVVLFPPSAAPFLYEQFAQRTETRVSPIRTKQKQIGEYPLSAHAKGVEAVVKAGEALYIPALWFHEVSSIGPSLAGLSRSVRLFVCLKPCFFLLLTVNVWFDLFDYAKRGLEHVYKTPSNILAAEIAKHEPLCKEEA
jgi:hypothetical protein